MNYWAVGAAWNSTEDVSNEFIEKGIWYDGYAENEGYMKYQKYWEQIKPEDILVMKSKGTKGKGHSTTFTRIKAIGQVKEKLKPHYLRINWWDIPELPVDVNGVYYATTI